MNFHYRIHSGTCHYIFYIIASKDIVLSSPSVRSHHPRNKSDCHQIHKIDRVRTFLKQSIQNFIISVNYGYDLALDCARGYRYAVMMSGLAVITAEFLICPSISDRASALQTKRRFSYVSLVLHNAKLKCFDHKSNSRNAGFSLSYVNSFFLVFTTGHKINFRSHKKDLKRIKKRKTFITEAWNAYKLPDFYFTLPSTCRARIMV